MSGWDGDDRYLDIVDNTRLSCRNNITVPGILPADKVPSPTTSHNIVQAHMKSLRLYRKYCRMLPFIIMHAGFRRLANPEEAKLHLADYFRQHNKVRNPQQIDEFVRQGYERLYNINQGDVWGTFISDHLAPQGKRNI